MNSLHYAIVHTYLPPFAQRLILKVLPFRVSMVMVLFIPIIFPAPFFTVQSKQDLTKL